MTKMKENVIAVMATLLLTWWVIAFIGSWDNDLATDLLWKKKDLTQKVDMSLVKVENEAKMLLNKEIDNIASITFELMFDESKISLSKDSIDSDYSISLTKLPAWNSYNVILQNIWNLKSWDDLFVIDNITNEQFDNINIWHIQVIDNNWNIMDLTSSK